MRGSKVLVAATIGFMLITSVAVAFASGVTTMVSRAHDGGVADNDSWRPSLSGDGRYVAFYSNAGNLVPADRNDMTDVFAYDSIEGTMSVVSVSTAGIQGNGASGDPSVSSNGRYVAFHSSASNLVPGDVNGTTDVFIRDRVAGTTSLVSVASSGVRSNGFSSTPSISSDGRFVAFYSVSSNLVPGDTRVMDVFLRDTVLGETRLVSAGVAGANGNNDSGIGPIAISPGGRYVAFYSNASNLVVGDANDMTDTFVRDTVAGTTTLVSVSTDGTQGNGASGVPSISSDGRHVVFHSSASNLVPGDTNGVTDVFVRDTVAGTTSLVSETFDGSCSTGQSFDPKITADGRYIAFYSSASNIVSGDSNGMGDIFVRDIVAGSTTRVSTASSGGNSNGPSGYSSSISDDGRCIAFDSVASNLAGFPTWARRNVFVRDTGAPAVITLGGLGETHVRWGNTVTLTGMLAANGTGLSSHAVTVQSSRDGHRWTDCDASVSTAADGGFRAVVQPVYAAWYRVVFTGDHDHSAAVSATTVRVVVEGGGGGARGAYAGPQDPDPQDPSASTRPAVGVPRSATAFRRAVPGSVTGILSPKHASGTYPVRLYLYRKVSGTWRSYGFVKAKVADSGASSKYSAAVRLPYSGSWRIRAFHPADSDHVAAWSGGYAYVTVR